VLQWDGLRVPTFDLHPEGTGLLRRAGLTADGWRSWLEAALADYRANRTRQRRPTAELWTGAAVIGRALAELWPAYLVAIEAGKQLKVEKLMGLTQGANYWKLLKPYHDRLPPLLVLTVDYPQTAAFPSPPDSLVIGLGDYDREAFERRLVTGAGALAAAA